MPKQLKWGSRKCKAPTEVFLTFKGTGKNVPLPKLKGGYKGHAYKELQGNKTRADVNLRKF